MAKAIHAMFRVQNEDRSIAFYQSAFGLKVADKFEFDDFTLIYLRNDDADFEVELTVNKNADAPYDLGNGYGHLAFSVDDLDAEHERFIAKGLMPKDKKTLEHNGKPLARFFFVEDPDGYKIEILQRQGRYT